MPTALICLQGFQAWENTFNKGDQIPLEVAQSWPGETMKNRLANGFMEFKSIEDQVVAATGGQPVAKEISAMSKAELIDYVATVYGTDLDPKMPLDKMREAAMALEKKG